MTREDKQSVISICRILADKMDDSGKIAVEQVISAVESMKEQEQNLDAINRQTAIETIDSWLSCDDYNEAEREIMRAARSMLLDLPCAMMAATVRCKDCKYFEYDSWTKHGIPLIVAHEICSKWGNGCKTREDGYCFLFEPKESEGKE